jgi:hypothetical protein
MKFKKIMLITLLLLVVLTIGAVSASDDVASDDSVAASDNVDIIADDGDGDEGDEGDDEYGAYYTGAEIITDEHDPDYDSDAFVASMAVPNTTDSGSFVISTHGVDDQNEEVLFEAPIIGDTENYWGIDEATKDLVCIVYLSDLKNLDSLVDGNLIFFEFIDDDEPVEGYCLEATLKVTDSTVQFYDEDNDDVYIEVDDGHDINITTMASMPFAHVSVPNWIQGNITIAVYGEEEPIYFFNRNLTDIEKHMDDTEHVGNTIYWISLSDLDDLDNFLKNDKFEIALIDDDEIESEEYGIKFEDDVVSFYSLEPREGEGTEIEAIFAEDANAVTDDVIVFISKDELLDVDDEFEVIVKYEADEADEDTINLNLTKIDSDEMGYYIKVSDLFPIEGIFEELEFDLLVQFYYNGEPVCYAESEDGILVYINPHINDKANLLMDDEIISFTPIAGADDEFKVTISKEGSADVVKTFKVSDLNNTSEDDEEPEYYSLKLSDLGITEGGNYTISVNFTQGGMELVSNVANVSVSDELEIYTMIDENTPESIADNIFIIRVPEEMKGYVKLYVDDVQVGGNISFDSLNYGIGPIGREVWLNNFNITETGDYDLKVDVFDEKGQFLANAAVSTHVEVGANTATFNDAYYARGDFIRFNLTSPISEDAYFIIYLNGKKAGIFRGNVYEDIEFDDEFVDTLGYGGHDRFLKVGDYVANITFFDGASVKDFATGSFSIKSMNMTTDKDKYLEGDNVTISFKADKPTEYSHLEVLLITGWGLMPDDHRIFAISSEDVVNAWKDGVITVNIGSLPLGANNLMIEYIVAESEEDFDGEDYLIDATDLITVNVVEPVDLGLTVSVANIEEGAAANVVIKTNAAFSGNVTVQIANKNYTVEVKNGAGSVSVSGLAANTYVATAIFAGSELFLNATASAQFTVTKKATPQPQKDKITLTLKKVKVKKSAKKLVLKATLKINGKAVKGKVIKFKFKGKTYKAKTNKKGVAKVTIKKKVLKKLKVGKKIKIQATYGKVTKKYTVKVKK